LQFLELKFEWYLIGAINRGLPQELYYIRSRMNVRKRIKAGYDRLNKLAGQFYTPRELRALLLFLMAGIAILLIRFGKQMYMGWFPKSRDKSEIVQKQREDSLFSALSAVANHRDSLFFSLPEDSLLPAATRATTTHHKKEEGLRDSSISLNMAAKEDLIRLPSVGPAGAELILEYRSERGPFRSLAELKNVHGFGETRFNKIKRYLKLN
jgi:competence ComEA-like helix-hairpin-helix protein